MIAIFGSALKADITAAQKLHSEKEAFLRSGHTSLSLQLFAFFTVGHLGCLSTLYNQRELELSEHTIMELENFIRGICAQNFLQKPPNMCSGCQTITRELVTLAYFSACWPRVTRVSTGWVTADHKSHSGEYLCGWPSDTAYICKNYCGDSNLENSCLEI